MNNSEFYIGWMSEAPKGFAKHVKKVVFILIGAVIIASVILATQQKKFSTSNFEFGQLTEVKGIYQQHPVPSIKVISHQDAFGNTSYITMPLVGYGKFGAEGTITELEKEKKISLDGKEVAFKGFLIYSDGKTLLQIDKNDNPLLNVKEANTIDASKPVIKELGELQLEGEILDPKCYFGVMKPGHGKPHRDCAIRCIAGGMSPVFYMKDQNRDINYCLLLGANGEKINDEIKDFIGEPVSLKARAIQYDDWIVLYKDNTAPIRRISGLSWLKTDDIISCSRPH